MKEYSLYANRIQQATIGVSEDRRSRVTTGRRRGICDLRSTGDGSRLVSLCTGEARLGYAARGQSEARRARDHVFRAPPGIEEASQLRVTHHRQR